MTTNPMDLTNVNIPQLHEFLNEYGSDGWTIWSPSKFTDMGFTLADLPIQSHKSDTHNPKYTIFDDNGKIIKVVKGVYNLTFLRKLASALNVAPNTGFLGRGSEARELTRRITQKLNTQSQN